MRNFLTFALAVVLGCAAASAQYFSTKQGEVSYYKLVDNKTKEAVESVVKTTVLSVDTDADGIITSRVEDIQSDPSNPFAEIKTYRVFKYDPKTDITTVIVMTGDDFKSFILNMIKASAEANRQHISESELADLEKAFATKGQLEFPLDPKAAVDSKLPNATLRLNAGQMAMSMNLWEGKFLGSESITVEAGTYDCLKVSYAIRTSTPGGNEKNYMTEWYAKGVGLVRSLETDKKGNTLADQTLRVVKE